MQSEEPSTLTNCRHIPAAVVVRPGLSSAMIFDHCTVEPADYRYEGNSYDGTVTISFNYGDTQLMLLTDEGIRLRFTFGGKDYCYEIDSK